MAGKATKELAATGSHDRPSVKVSMQRCCSCRLPHRPCSRVRLRGERFVGVRFDLSTP